MSQETAKRGEHKVRPCGTRNRTQEMDFVIGSDYAAVGSGTSIISLV